MDTFNRVKMIIAKHLGMNEDAITMSSSFRDDLGADSLDMVEISMSVEEEFDVEISDADAETLGTVGDFINFLNEITDRSGKKAPLMDNNFFPVA